MVSLYFVGTVLEPAIGRLNFAAVYFASLLAGSFGALLFQPDVPTLGASGAIFGIFGALIIVAYHRGIPIWQSGLGSVLVFNLLFTFTRLQDLDRWSPRWTRRRLDLRRDDRSVDRAPADAEVALAGIAAVGIVERDRRDRGGRQPRPHAARAHALAALRPHLS